MSAERVGTGGRHFLPRYDDHRWRRRPDGGAYFCQRFGEHDVAESALLRLEPALRGSRLKQAEALAAVAYVGGGETPRAAQAITGQDGHPIRTDGR
jgi:hypothetical protein